MCGRVVLKGDPEELRDLVNLSRVFIKLVNRYNVAPSQEVPVIRLASDGERELVLLRWGLVPHWAKPEKNLKPQINARGEDIESKPFFRTAFRRNRCLIPVSGFYEWQKAGEHKQPHFIHRPDDRSFLLAGIWDAPEELEKQTFAIITTEANEVVSPIHNRMPVIISPDSIDEWLKGDVNGAKSLLQPYAGELEAYPVSTFVNSPMNNSEECVRQRA